MYDVIVIGGGLSGTSAGRKTGKLGLNTLLLEKEEFPRYKPSGGGISEHAISYLDFELPPDIIEWEVTRAKVIFKNQLVKAHKITDCLFSSLETNLIISFLKKQKRQGLKSIPEKRLFAAGNFPTVLKWTPCRGQQSKICNHCRRRPGVCQNLCTACG